MADDRKAEEGYGAILALHSVDRDELVLRHADLSEKLSQFSGFAKEEFGIEPEMLVGYTMAGTEIPQDSPLRAAGVVDRSTIILLADTQGESELVSTADTDPMFRDMYARWYDASEDTVLKAVEEALVQIKKSRTYRVNAAAGSGIQHMFWVLRRYRDHPKIQLAALRFLAEAAIHEDAEKRVFQAGGTDLAIEIGKQSGLELETRQHAARFFFNLCYQKSTRMSVVEKGGLDHCVFLILDDPCDKTSGLGMKMILSTAKALVMLSLVKEIRPKMLAHPRMEAALLRVATHENREVWLRAAKVIKFLATDPDCKTDLTSNWGGLVASLYGMDETNTFVKDALAAICS